MLCTSHIFSRSLFAFFWLLSTFQSLAVAECERCSLEKQQQRRAPWMVVWTQELDQQSQSLLWRGFATSMFYQWKNQGCINGAVKCFVYTNDNWKIWSLLPFPMKSWNLDLWYVQDTFTEPSRLTCWYHFLKLQFIWPKHILTRITTPPIVLFHDPKRMMEERLTASSCFGGCTSSNHCQHWWKPFPYVVFLNSRSHYPWYFGRICVLRIFRNLFFQRSSNT